MERTVKILVAVDGSQFSEAATQVLATRFRPQDCEVLLVHVIEAPAFFEQDAQLQERRGRGEKLMAHVAETLQGAGFRNIGTRVVEGEPRLCIPEVASEWRADCIVLGSHGRKGLQKLLLGSVAQSVAQHASCSVLIVRVPSAS
jgi:nucleotide-binding universal stress UspA family protein